MDIIVAPFQSMTSSRRWRFRIAVACAALALAILAAPVVAEFVQIDVVEVPVDRVVANLESQIAGEPKNVTLIVNLARIHAMAYAQKTDGIPVARNGPQNAPYTEHLKENVLPEVRATGGDAKRTAAEIHLTEALRRYEEALKLSPANPVANLGFAWTLQQAGRTAQAIASYRTTIEKSWPLDIGRDVMMVGWRSITEEAVRYLVPLLDPDRDKVEIADLRAKVAQIKRMARAITPIAIPVRDGVTAFDIVDETARVSFDLDGSGIKKPWTWITTDGAWLVMDLHGRRQIRSGLQLFGSVTFWLFWDNGYQALRALDDDGDGRLRGGELDGLALWHDLNRNAISDPGEVQTVAAWGIVELSCVYEHDARHPDEIAFSPAGVVFRDGTVRSTYDVVLAARQ